MKVKALKNLIYDGTFRKAAEIFSMPANDVVDYEKRHWVSRLLQVPKPAAKAPDLPASLPPLVADDKKKK